MTKQTEALAEQPTQTATYTCGVCGVSMQMEQPAQQEPVAWMSDNDIGFKKSEFGATPTVPLYTSPPASKPLTDEQIKIIWRDIDGSEGMLMRVARAIEAAHGITGETE